MNVRNFFAALLFVALPAAAAVSADQTTTVIEFYNQSLDHYFMTADTAEAADLDNGVHPGWARTGLTFLAIKAGASVAGSTPIGRFYGSPSAGLDSHFYSASAQETADVQSKFPGIWLLESPEVFRAIPVDSNSGKCPTDYEPIYRLYNNRRDVNHRYTDDVAVFQSMVAKGYLAEGNGNPSLPVVFCMPAKDNSVAPAGTPSCTVSATSTSPMLGTFITLTATCSNAPSQYAWTNCSSSLNTCTIASSTAGTTTYSVVGTNSTGAGNTAKVDVNWGSSGGPVPICTISASSTTPQAGNNVTLTANCSQSPTQYAWMTCNYLLQTACNFIATCPTSSSTCTTTQSSAGLAHYALAATNSAGQGPRAGIDLDWGGSGGGGGGGGNTAPVCTVNPSNSSPTIGTTIQLFASCSGSPSSYAWTNCTSNTSTCSTSAASAGNVTYTVVGSNSIGNGAPASTTVSWQRPAPPSCTVSSSSSTPMVGTNVTLTANCSGSPTNYLWTGCAGSNSTCVTTAANAGAQVYSVSGVNGSGTGATANVTVTWQPRPTAPPACTVSADNTSPFTGQSITLTANCNNSPTSYNWTNCSSTHSTCTTTSVNAGSQTYSVSATNVVGTGTPASVNVSWQQSTSSDFCGQYRDVRRQSQAWGSSTPIIPSNFAASAVLVVAVTVPGVSPGNANFGATVSEYQSAPSTREITLSRSACDFRPIDNTGQNGPISLQFGNTASAYGTASMLGGTWYFNVRSTNRDGSGSCATSTCNIIVGFHY